MSLLLLLGGGAPTVPLEVTTAFPRFLAVRALARFPVLFATPRFRDIALPYKRGGTMPPPVPYSEAYTTDSIIRTVDFSAWPQLASDTIASAVVHSVSPVGMTATYLSVASGGKQVLVQHSGGTAGVEYTVCVLATTAGGQTLTQEFAVNVFAT
jgi:hypothetical protein